MTLSNLFILTTDIMLMKEFTANRDDIALTQSIAMNEFTLKTEKNALIDLHE